MQNFQHHQYLGHFLKPLVPIHHLEKRKTGKGMMGPQLLLRMPALAATGSPPENCFTPRVCWGICTVYTSKEDHNRGQVLERKTFQLMPGHLSPLPSVNVKLPNCGITHQAASILRRQANHCWHSSHLNIVWFAFKAFLSWRLISPMPC